VSLDAEHNFVTLPDSQSITHSLRRRHLALGRDRGQLPFEVSVLPRCSRDTAPEGKTGLGG
jgi:hypothetical protein